MTNMFNGSKSNVKTYLTTNGDLAITNDNTFITNGANNSQKRNCFCVEYI